ncbi:MAG TPA: hypothetical protein VGR00_02380 [Thermoanaerobaculia bacterium]|jgi:hypothetical protein|nr:hypothetical protein [Thermoanaerobaculia bacterium]
MRGLFSVSLLALVACHSAPPPASASVAGHESVLLALGDGQSFSSTEAAIASTPAWNPDEAVVPLSSLRAVALARAWLRRNRPADAEAGVESVAVHRVGPTRTKDRWFYLIGFGPEPRRFDFVVLLDGTVVVSEEEKR